MKITVTIESDNREDFQSFKNWLRGENEKRTLQKRSPKEYIWITGPKKTREIKVKDFDEMAEITRQKHKNQVNAALHGRWSLNYDKCKKCGTTTVKHMGLGFCRDCYLENLHERKRQELLGKKLCANPKCPYNCPNDYLEYELIQHKDKKYCSRFCIDESEASLLVDNSKPV